YLCWLNDPQVSGYLETRHSPQDMASVRAFVESVAARDNEVLFGIFLREDGRHIGNIKVGPIHPWHRLADVSLLIGDKGCWGRGFAAEAIEALSRYAFAHLPVEKLSASMYWENEGSRRAFLKAGYREEGRRRAHYRLAEARSDLIELGCLPSDLEAQA
ncbi:MAG TPA: GNAT family N-acetyltransferase, partial [Allosphingosinicella sp.]